MVDRAMARGDRAEATATIEALARHLGIPELASLLPRFARAIRLDIAYGNTHDRSLAS
jgi:hypothetical protein